MGKQQRINPGNVFVIVIAVLTVLSGQRRSDVRGKGRRRSRAKTILVELYVSTTR